MNEVKKLALKDVKLKIYAPPERKVCNPSNLVVIADVVTVLDVDRGFNLSWTKYIQEGELATVPRSGALPASLFLVGKQLITCIPDVGVSGRVQRRPRYHSQKGVLGRSPVAPCGYDALQTHTVFWA